MSSLALRQRIERLSPRARTALAEHVNRLSADGDATQLVCWAAVDAETGITSDALLAFLRRSLPDHMIPARLVLLDKLPRLPNGKIDTAALSDARPASAAPATTGPMTEKERILASIWRDVLGADRVDANDNFFELGGDSILSIQVVARARRAGLHVTPESVFESHTLRDLAAAAGTQAESPSRPQLEIASAPLSPIQAWFFEQPLAEPHHWHQALVLQVAPGFDRHRFENAVERLVQRHDALRLTFRRDGTRWTQHIGSSRPVVRRVHVDDPAHIRSVVHDACATTRLDTGPLLQALMAHAADEVVSHVALAIHHLVVDAVSWDVLLADLAALYANPDDSPLDAPTSFLAACTHLAHMAPKVAASGPFWTDVPDAPRLPVDHDGLFTEASAFTVRDQLDASDTAALLDDPHTAYNTKVEDLLIAALIRTIARWSGLQRVRVGVERHGRDEFFRDLDVSRTVGWLTSFFPLTLDVPAGLDPGAIITRTKDSLRALPHRGASYGLLRCGGPADIAARLSRQPNPEIVFNHGGRFVRRLEHSIPWRPAGTPFASRAPANGRAYRFEINTWVGDGSLVVEWTASDQQYHRDTISHLLARYLDDIRLLVRRAATAETSGFTPADFPDAGLDQAALDRFLGGLDP